MSLEMAHKVIVPQKKIMSRSFLNSGTLIVITAGASCFWSTKWNQLKFSFKIFIFILQSYKSSHGITTMDIGSSPKNSMAA
jgi:hypothetical protein